MPSSLSTIKTMEKNIDIITLGKKIGKIEISTSHMNEQLKEESNNKRMILEKKTDKMAENISSELSIVKTGFDSISLMFKEGLDKMKKSIMEEVDFKTSSILKIVKDSVNKIDQFETSKNIENFELYKTEVDKRFKKLEKIVSIPTPNRDIEINTGLAKITFLEKKLNEQIKQMNDKMIQFSKDINIIKKDIEIIKKTKYDSKDKLDHFQRDFISTNSNNLKFNYQTTMMLNETNEKIKTFEELLKKQTEELNQLKVELCTQFSETKTNVDNNINSFGEEFKTISHELLMNQNNFHDHIISQNEKFVSFIQEKYNSFSGLINEKINQCEKNYLILNSEKNEQSEKIALLQKEFFNNLNEVEEFLTKKYDNLSNLLNMKIK